MTAEYIAPMAFSRAAKNMVAMSKTSSIQVVKLETILQKYNGKKPLNYLENKNKLLELESKYLSANLKSNKCNQILRVFFLFMSYNGSASPLYDIYFLKCVITRVYTIFQIMVWINAPFFIYS